jgi:hypothetical protein
MLGFEQFIFAYRTVAEIVVASENARIKKYHQGSSKHASFLPHATLLTAMIHAEGQ